VNVVYDDVAAARWAGEMLDTTFAQPLIGFVIKDGPAINGAVIFNGWTDQNIDMTGVGMGCWTPGVIRYLARYCFKQLGVKRVSAQTRASNTKARNALVAMGFVGEGFCEDWFPDGEAAVLYGLLARNQRLVK
jgi:hypothetical protein